jgi:hypothetical protein
MIDWNVQSDLSDLLQGSPRAWDVERNIIETDTAVVIADANARLDAAFVGPGQTH